MSIRTAVAVVLAWQSLSLVSNVPQTNAQPKSMYHHAPKQVRDDGCFTLSRGPGVNLQGENPGLHKFLEDLKREFEKGRWQNFKSYFHPQLKVKKRIGEQIRAILMNRYKKPWQFSIYRVWELNDKENNKKLYQCPNTEFERIGSRFGYKSQYFVIMQVMGQNELGRILLSIAPKKDQELAIIGFHIQQWTHQGLDWQKWSEKGNQALQAKNSKQAYISYSVSEKMLEGGDFVQYEYRNEIRNEMTKIFDPVSLVANIRKDGANPDIVYAASLLHQEGTGIFVRIHITKEESSETLINWCKAVGRSLKEKGWIIAGEGGIKCSYIPKGADPNKDSIVGGFYVSQKDFG